MKIMLNRITPIYFLNIIHKIVVNYIIFFLKVIWLKNICKFSYGLSCKHKINKSNTKISAYYQVVFLYSKNICRYVFILQSIAKWRTKDEGQRTINKCFYLFRNMSYTKRIEISNINISNIQSNPISSNIRVLINIYYISPTLYFAEIISRINTSNLGSL